MFWNFDETEPTTQGAQPPPVPTSVLFLFIGVFFSYEKKKISHFSLFVGLEGTLTIFVNFGGKFTQIKVLEGH